MRRIDFTENATLYDLNILYTDAPVVLYMTVGIPGIPLNSGTLNYLTSHLSGPMVNKGLGHTGRHPSVDQLWSSTVRGH